MAVKELRIRVFFEPESGLEHDRFKPVPYRAHTRVSFSLIFVVSCLHDQINDPSHSYLLIILQKNVNLKMIFYVWPCLLLLSRLDDARIWKDSQLLICSSLRDSFRFDLTFEKIIQGSPETTLFSENSFLKILKPGRIDLVFY